MSKISNAFLALLLVQSVFGQNTDTLFSKELAEVIVTGQYRPQSVKNSVYQVRIITAEQIRRQGASALPDLLNKQLNIRFSQDLATGGSSITLMGMKGQNVKILVDGLPVTGRQGASNEIDASQIDINSIERIEIVEGPMSVVYGADALAGVINIITRSASRSSLSVIAKLHEETVGNEYGFRQGIHNQYLGLTSRVKNWELGASLGHNYFGGWRDTASDRELTWHKKDQLIANAFIGYADGKFRARYKVDGLDELIVNPGNFLFAEQASGDTLAKDQEYLTRRVMHQVSAGYTPNGKWNVHLQSAFTQYSRQVFSTTVSKKTGDTRLDIASGSQSIADFTGFSFRTAATYTFSDLVTVQPGIDIQLDAGEGERLTAGNNKLADYAFFMTAEITPTIKWNIRPGIRIISNSVYQAPPIVPSLNLKYAISKTLDLRLAYAYGFRAPSLRELYFNFFDANHQILGNPDLEAERSQSFTGSLNWKKAGSPKRAYTMQLAGFYNKMKNGIDYAVSATNPDIFILSNVEESKTAGINASITMQDTRWNLAVGAGSTGFYNQFIKADERLDELLWSPEVTSSFTWMIPSCGLDMNLFYKFTGKRPFYTLNNNQELILAEQQGFHLADLTLNKKAFRYFSIQAGIRNLFDVDRVKSNSSNSGVHSSNGITNIATGRSFFTGIIFNWSKPTSKQ